MQEKINVYGMLQLMENRSHFYQTFSNMIIDEHTHANNFTCGPQMHTNQNGGNF